MRVLPPIVPPAEEISVLARILWGPDRFRIVETLPTAYRIICSDGTGKTRKLAFADIQGLLDTNEIVLEQGYFDLDGNPAPKGSPFQMISTCTPKEQYGILDKLTWSQLFDEAYNAGEVKKYEKSMTPWIIDTYPTWMEKMKIFFDPKTVESEKERDKPAKVRRNQPTGDVGYPSASSLKGDYAKFCRSNFRPTDFRSNTDNCIHGGKRLSLDLVLEVERIIREHYATEARITLAELTRFIATQLSATHSPPHAQTVSKIIKTFPDARIIGSRYGLKVMRETKGMFSEGPRYTMAGEMVYLDAWKTDIVVILQRCGAWMKLSRPQRRQLKSLKGRVWVCVAMDVASRVILGISFGLAESSELARRVLRMAVSDKADYADMAGCQAPPPEQIGISAIRTDAGVAFIDADFAFAALSVTGDVAVGMVGRPNFRGPMERFFRTVGSQFLGYFTGRTFGNVVEKGDYEPELRVSLFLEDFGNAFFRYINDIYHLRGHAGISNQPPIEFFKEAINSTSCADVLTDGELRKAFGYRKTRRLTPAGIRYMNVEYRANWMATVLRNYSGDALDMEILVDPVDMGRILVLHANEWHTVLGPVELQGVGLTQLLESCRAVDAKHTFQADVHWPIVAEAMKDLANLSAKARVEAGLLNMGYDSETLDRAEESMRIRVVYRPSPGSFRHPLAITQGGLGVGHAVTGSVLALPVPVAEQEVTDDIDDEVYEDIPDPDDGAGRPEDSEDDEVAPSQPDDVDEQPTLPTAELPPAPKVKRYFGNQEDGDE